MRAAVQMSTTGFRGRELSLLPSILGGALLALIASATSPANFALVDLVVFLAIPSLAGAFSGFSDRQDSSGYGILVGSAVGLVYVIMTAVGMASPQPANSVLFLVLSVPIWGFLGGAGALVAQRASTASRLGPFPLPKTCGSCSSSNPPDALFCKNCGTKLQ